MSRNLHDPRTADAAHDSKLGLDPNELRAEQASDLPERDAMSVIGVGGIEVGLPPAGILDDLLGSDLPVHALPVDGLPVERLPIDQLPIDRLPVDPPVDTLPVEPPVDGLPVESPVDDGGIGVPNLPAPSADASIRA